MSLNPYLGFAGNCEEAFTFYAKVLGAKILAMIKISETPMAESSPPDRKDKIVHAPEEAERVFNALAEGGKITMPIAETFWAKRFGTLIDRFGTAWMINCEKPAS